MSFYTLVIVKLETDSIRFSAVQKLISIIIDNVLTSYFSWIWGPAWAMYNVLAVSNTSSRGILVTRCLAISWQFRYKVTSVVDTLITILDHFLDNFGTVNFATSSECECRSELVYTNETFWLVPGPSYRGMKIIKIRTINNNK